MDMQRVDGSSRIVGYGWEGNRVAGARNGTLAIEFVGGARWLYFGVPERVFEDWLLAESRGVFFERFIRHVYEGRAAEAHDGLTSVSRTE